MSNKRKIIFDLDETLYGDSSLRERREKAILDFLGERREAYLKLKKTRGTIASLNKLGIDKKGFYDIIAKVEINLKKDIKLRKIIKQLKKEFELIVLSNVSKGLVAKTLKKIGIIDLIDNYYGSDCFSQQKPSLECFFMVKKGDICIGNNYEKDLEVPQGKGAVTILIGKDDSRPDFCVKGVHDILKVINQVTRG